MKSYSPATALRPLLLAAVSILALQPTSVIAADVASTIPAVGSAVPPASQNATPLSAEALLSMYVATHPALRTDAAFARDWTTTTKCLAWSPISGDEFRGPAFLKAGSAELASQTSVVASIYVLRLERFLGVYNSTTQEFGLETFSPRPVLPVRIIGFGSEEGGSNFRQGCAPSSGNFPLRYDLAFDNGTVANGVSMPPDQAEANARSRTNQYGQRDNSVIVDVRFTVSPDGAARPVNAIGVRGLIIPLKAHIVDVAVMDATPQHRLLYRTPETKLKAGAAETAAIASDARVDAAARPLTAAILSEQFRTERETPSVGTQPTRLFVDIPWTRQEGSPDIRRLPLAGNTTYTLDGTSLRFVNAAEVAALSPNPALKPSLDGLFQLRVALSYVPVGAYDDPLKGGRVVVGHVVSVDTRSNDNGPERFITTPTTSPPALWKGNELNARLASAFDVLGIKAGMGVAEVSRIAKAELGQALVFNETTGVLNSPPTECEFNFLPDGTHPPLGRRCFVGTFLKQPGGLGWTLAKLQLRQTIALDQRPKMSEGMRAKYDEPNHAQGYSGRIGPSGMQTVPSFATGWGAQLTPERPEADGVPFPLHALELVLERYEDIVVMTLTLTDWAALHPAEIARAAPVTPAAAPIAPKF